MGRERRPIENRTCIKSPGHVQFCSWFVWLRASRSVPYMEGRSDAIYSTFIRLVLQKWERFYRKSGVIKGQDTSDESEAIGRGYEWD